MDKWSLVSRSDTPDRLSRCDTVEHTAYPGVVVEWNGPGGLVP